jgi:radical SAM protein with 4Fe4S-binding SPASM domain
MAKNSTHHVIVGEDIPKYKNILTRYLNAHVEQFNQLGASSKGELLATNLFHTGMGVLPYVRTLQEQHVPLLKSNCGVDDSRLISMDMLGNVRTCQNTDESYISGNLMDIKGVRIKNISLNRDAHCSSCDVRRLCKSSCPLNLGSATFQTNCAVEKVHY